MTVLDLPPHKERGWCTVHSGSFYDLGVNPPLSWPPPSLSSCQPPFRLHSELSPMFSTLQESFPLWHAVPDYCCSFGTIFVPLEIIWHHLNRWNLPHSTQLKGSVSFAEWWLKPDHLKLTSNKANISNWTCSSLTFSCSCCILVDYFCKLKEPVGPKTNNNNTLVAPYLAPFRFILFLSDLNANSAIGVSDVAGLTQFMASATCRWCSGFHWGHQLKFEMWR